MLDTISDTSKDDGREAESAIHNLLGPGKDEDEELVKMFGCHTGNARKQKLVTPKGIQQALHWQDLDYQHIKDEVISNENDVQDSDSKSDSNDEVEGMLHDNISKIGSKKLYVNAV